MNYPYLGMRFCSPVACSMRRLCSIKCTGSVLINQTSHKWLKTELPLQQQRIGLPPPGREIEPRAVREPATGVSVTHPFIVSGLAD